MREYDRFEKGAANSNTSTAVLKKQLEDPSARIIITTIQKLGDVHRGEQGPRDLRRPRRDHLRRVPPLAVRRHAHRDHQGVQALQPVRLHRHADLRGQRRHAAATRTLQARPSRRSASKLHTYTIVDAITDKNVLPFRIDYVNTIKVGPRRRRQAGLGHRHRAGAARTRAARARSSTTRWSTSTRRPSAPQHYSLGEQARARLQRAVRHRLDRRRQALLHRVQDAAGRR